MCDLSEGTESFLEIQVAEEIVTKVDNDTTETTDMLKQAEPACDLNSIDNGDVAVTENNNIEINLPEWVPSYGSVQSLQNADKTMVVSDKITPVYEGLKEIKNVNMGNNESGIDLDSLEILIATIERASIIEQICESASMQTPLPQFSSSFEQHQVQDLYGVIADEILDEDSRMNLQTSDNDITKIDSPIPRQQNLDYSIPYYFQSKNHYSSPVGKLWDRSYSSSGSSEIHLSSNPDLTCFPIEEDPCNNEENDDEVVAGIQEPHIERHVATPLMKYTDRCSSISVSIEVSVPRTREKDKRKPKIPHGIKVSRYNEDNRNSLIATCASGKGNVSVNSKKKSIMKQNSESITTKG
ncbi:uncharacterized protein LOC143628142 [Bidens hawaiensis]|uniref:uncharacterized protein LOC143628142 n=1 Tax=Bidens hawaiensis TaxID=980011 RepID=UPI00404A7C82